MRTAKRIENLPPYLFVEISKKIAEKQKKGEDVISLAIGDPDIPTPLHVIERLCQEALWFSQSMLLGSRRDMEDIVRAVTKIRENVGELN